MQQTYFIWGQRRKYFPNWKTITIMQSCFLLNRTKWWRYRLSMR